MKKLISFDLDQTLVATIRAHYEAFKLAFKSKNIKVNFKQMAPLLDGRHSNEIIISVSSNLNKKEVQEIRELHHKFLNKTSKYAHPIEGALKTLKILKRNFKLALLTNCGTEEERILLKSAKISKKIFDVAILADQVEHPKPWPDEIFKAEKIVHVKSDVHVGDSIYDVIAAKKAGVISVGVLTGYNSSKLLKCKPDFIIKDVTYLPKLLSKIKF